MKAWTIKLNTKAPQAAGRIHGDMEKGFIMAEVMKFVDFKELGSENACKVCASATELRDILLCAIIIQVMQFSWF